MKKNCLLFSLLFSITAFAQTPTLNSVIYEVNVRQYSEEGSFAAVAQNLPQLKSLGIDILWLMPVHPIGEKNRKGSMGSYYSVRDYRGIDPSYGNEADFKAFVNAAHRLGMKVIIDWVANHTAWDHEWIENHPEWYVQDSTGAIQTQYDWTDVAKLNYKNNDMRKAMIADMQYWLNTFGIDGFRCDVAFLVPQDFWEQARTALESTKPVYMLAEMEWNTDITSNPAGYFTKAFNTSYGWNFMGVTQDFAKRKKTLQDFRKEMNENYKRFPVQMTKLFFITNHDENSWNGTIQEKYGNDWKLYATLCYTLPKSTPLMYTGEEVGLNRRLQFFEKDPITQDEWKDTSRFAWYRSLIDFRHQHPALWNHPNTPAVIEELNVNDDIANVFAFKRTHQQKEVIVITNFGTTDTEIAPAKLGKAGNYRQLFPSESFYRNKKGNWVLKAKSNVILYN